MWILARTASKRPSLMHRLLDGSIYLTDCGLDVSGWSRAYLDTVIPQIECLRCKRSRS